MTDELELSLDQRRSRAGEASRAFGDVSWAFDKVEAAMLAKMSATPVTNPEVVLRLHAGIQALDAVRVAIRMVVDDGLAAEHAIQAANLAR